MAGLLDAFWALPPELRGAMLSQLDPSWQPQQQGPPPGPRLQYDPAGPGTMVDLRGGGQLMAPPGPQRVATPQLGIGGGGGPQQFPELGGFGVSPGSMVGLPADVPMPRVSAPRPVRPQPDPLTIESDLVPPNARPTAGRGLSAAALPTPQPPPQYRPPPEMYAPPPQQEPGFFDRIGAGFSNLLNNPSLPGLVEGARGFASGRYTDPTSIAREYQMATYNNLRRAGYSHPDAAMAANNPAVLKQLVEQAYAPQKLQGFQPGESVYSTGGGGLAGARGGLNVRQLTPGLSAEEQAAQRAGGEVRGKAAATLPATMQSADQALSVIDQLQNHPGKSLAVGRLSVVPAIPGTRQGDFVTLLQQAQGQTFLQAYQQLKGGGAISEAEGAKAEAAVGRLSRAQTPGAFDAALNELRGVIQAGKQNAQRIARSDTQGYTSPQPVAGWTTIAPGIRIRPKQ